MNNNDTLNQLIQRHTDLGEMGTLFWNLGQYEDGDKCFAEANEVWEQFMALYEV